ncbi:MAG TPA: toxic anion resistance protein, partial [Chroococcales cyanobacterium]
MTVQTTDAPAAVPQLKFAIPGAATAPPPLDIPAPVDQPIASGLATIPNNNDSRQALVCKDMIDATTLAQAQAAAKQLLPAMLKDTDVFMNYGQAALKDVNDLIDIMLKQINSSSMGPIKELMNQAYLNMRNIKGKYDLSDPKAKKAYDEWEHGKIKQLIHRGRNYFEAMRADMMTVDTQLDKLNADLKARYVDIRNTTKLLDQLYEKNEASIYTLIQTIAVMELISEQARTEAAALPDTDPVTNQQNEEKRKRVDLIQQMDIKIAEYKGRLFVAWSTSPQLRMMRVLDVGMAEKINEAINITIYNIKLAMVEWRAQAQAVEDAKATESL